MGQEPQPSEEDSIHLEFFDLTTDEIRFTVDLDRETFERYQLSAQSMGVTFEEFMADIAEAQVREENTEWFMPLVNAEGYVEPDRSRPFLPPTPDQITGNEV